LKSVRRWLLLGGAALLLLLLAPVALLLGWGSSDGSLASALAQAPRWLPVGHSLETRDVQGNLAHGGRVGWLRWQHGGLSVEATGVRSCSTAS